jgi:ATP-dependent Clp protease ATP-binding subunit ClpA
MIILLSNYHNGITNRFLPDKAIDLMDEAASKYAWKSIQNQKNWMFWIEK